MTPCKIDDRFATFIIKGQDPEMVAEAIGHAIEQIAMMMLMQNMGMTQE